MTTLDSFNLENLVHFSTHKCRHTLDLLITDKNWDHGIVPSQGHMIADHNAVHARVRIQNEIEKNETITYRKIKNINKEKFANDLETAVTKIQHQNSLADKVEKYNTELKGVLDKHSPVKTKTVKITHQNPWFNDKDQGGNKAKREERKSMEQRSNILQLSGLLLPKEVCSKPNKSDQIRILQIPNSRTPWRL